MITVRDLIRIKGSDVWHVYPETPAIEALRQLKEKDIGALLVVDHDHRLAGIISERDFARSIADNGQIYAYKPVSEYMTSEVITVHLKQTLEECMRLMLDNHIRHLPVMDESGNLAGVISVGDVLSQVISYQNGQIDDLQKYIEGRGYITH